MTAIKEHVISLARLAGALLTCLALLVSPLALAEDKIVINGLPSSELEKNVRLLLSEVSTPIGRINEDKYKQSLLTQAEKALQAFAYYDASLTVTDLRFTTQTNEDNKSVQHVAYTLNVDLGSKAIVEQVVLLNDLAQTDQQALPPQIVEVIEQVKQFKGKPLDHPKYENLKNKLKTLVLLYGYFDFIFPVHKLIVEPPKNSNDGASDTSISSSEQKPKSKAIVHWIFYLGKRYQFGKVVFLGDTRGQDIAQSVKPFKYGEYFEQSKVGDYSIDMQSTDYFSSAIARANAGNASDYKVPIEVILDPKPKDTFEFGLGVSTDTGPRVTVDWSRPWVNLRGHSLGARLYLSRPRKSLKANYRIPMANPLNDFFNFQAGFNQVDENQTRSDNFSLAVQRQWGAVEEDDWDKIAFVKFEQESFVQGAAEEETTNLLLPGFSFSRTRKRGEIFVEWGDLQQITVEGGTKALLSDIDFFKVLARTKWIREFGQHRFLLRADAGAISTSDFSRVPSTQRFFAGGDQSIRGFGLNEVSDFEFVTVDGEEKKELLGGKYLAVASVEYSYPVAEKFRAAVFVDAGNANDNPIKNYAYGYGVGMHWLSPIGTVRLYLARGQDELESKFRLHLVIGPGL
ncbi:autotransporter assembly complex family protein [Glaciecola siphonariae]|uniref:Translocation and assembly module subunit TamA n=1 Tax=Glaciecola siphonariae TaxID=521012 RepID=A0ABV9LVH3_9ALTE